MKTFYLQKLNFFYKIGVIALVLFFNSSLQAQVVEEPQDSIKPGYSQGSLHLKNPQSILEAYTYDPVTDRYIYTNSVDGFNINYPIILTPKEYEQMVLRESMRGYFKKKSDAIDGKKEGKLVKKIYCRDIISTPVFSPPFLEVTLSM